MVIGNKKFFVKLLRDVSGMVYMDTHLKVVLDFRGAFDIYFLFIVEIRLDVKKGSGSDLISISCQTFTVYPFRSDLVYLSPNI